MIEKPAEGRSERLGAARSGGVPTYERRSESTWNDGDRLGEIRAKIERTEAEVAQTLSAIQERLAFENLVNEAQNRFFNSAEESVQAIGRYAGRMSREMSRSVSDTVRKYPASTALVGLGLGLGWFFSRSMRGDSDGMSQRKTVGERRGAVRYDSFERNARHYEPGSESAGYSGVEQSPGVFLRESETPPGTGPDLDEEQGYRGIYSESSEHGEGGLRSAVKGRSTVMRIAAVAAVGIGLGLLLPKTRRGRQFMEEARETVGHGAREFVEETKEKAGQAVDQAIHGAKEETDRQGLVSEP